MDYPVVPYYENNPYKIRKLHKYNISYNSRIHRCESEDKFIELGRHDKFVQILFIKRFIEKHMARSPLAAPLELVHNIFAFIHDKNAYCVIVILPKKLLSTNSLYQWQYAI